MRVTGATETTPFVAPELSLDRSLDSTSKTVNDVSFGDIFARTIQQANETDHVATTKVDALAAGTSDDLHGTMIAVKEADISIKLVGTIRNKLLDAFNEIWKTSV